MRIEPQTKKNILMLVLAVLAANSIPMAQALIRPLMNYALPLPIIENVGAVFGVFAIVLLKWLYDKDF